MAKEIYALQLAKLPASYSFNGEMCGGVQNNMTDSDVWGVVSAFLPNLPH